MKLRVAADIGGTFTDIALIFPDGRLASRKVPSTPADYGVAVAEGISQLLAGERIRAEEIGEVLHACTVATNAILERKGAKTALVTTEGFRDVLEMRRIRSCARCYVGPHAGLGSNTRACSVTILLNPTTT